MFTGIIESVGEVETLTQAEEGSKIVVRTGFLDLALGESVAVNGACLTVTEHADGLARFFVSRETLERTNLSRIAVGSRVNLERALQAGARLSGHWVQGHVDGLATLLSVAPEGESHRLEFRLPGKLARYCVEKGSIALDGVSLTVNAVARKPDAEDGDARIAITVIPHTWAHTAMRELAAGDAANVEVDILAKYVEALCLN